MRGVWRKLIKGKSTFDYDYFPTEYIGLMCFNKQRYTEDEAIELWRREMAYKNNEPCLLEDAFVRYRYGTDDEGNPRSCWWHEWEDYGNRSVPVWSIRAPYPWEKDGSVEEI